MGVLSTSGSYTFQLYESVLENAGYTAVMLSPDQQETLVHDSIYNPEYGIKSTGRPVSLLTVEQLKEAVNILIDQGAEAIILGCTEIPLALTEKTLNKTLLIDPNRALARALIIEFDHKKLIEP